MCDAAGILGQFKNMAGGDYASIADNLTRELLVIFMESPEDRKTIQGIMEAGQCASKVAADSGLLEEQDEDSIENSEDPGSWEGFSSDTDAALEAAEKAAECLDNVDRYAVGKISGRLFGKFFKQELEANM